jgi:hypothetical protein
VEQPPGGISRTPFGLISRTVVRQTHQHPEIVFRTDALLMSINDRLGALLPPDRNAGCDLVPLSSVWVEELIRFGVAEAEDQDDALEESERERHAG